MAIEHVSTGSLAAAAATSVTVTLPTHASGDLIVVFGGGREDSPADNLTISGWTAIGTQAFLDLGSNAITLHAWYKFATSSSESDPTITGGGSATGGTFGFAQVYRGVDQTTPLSGVTPLQGTNAAAATFTPPSITPDSANSRWVVSCVATADDNALSATTTQGFTTRADGGAYDTTTGLDIAFALTDKAVTQSSAVTLPTYTETLVGNDAWAYKTFVLRAAPATVSADASLAVAFSNTATGSKTRVDTATPDVWSSAASNSGTGTSSTVSLTLPLDITAGDVGYLVVTVNTDASVNDPGDGWTLIDTALSATVLQQRVYRKALDASYSGAVVSYGLGSSQKWNAAVVVVGSDGGLTGDTNQWTSGTASSSWRLETVTPDAPDALLLGFHAWRVGATGTTTSTPPTDWTEVVETSLNAAVLPTNGAGICQRQITGGEGSPTGDRTDGAYDQSASNHVSFVLAIRPKSITLSASASLPISLTDTADATAVVEAQATLPVYFANTGEPEGATSLNADASLAVALSNTSRGVSEWEELFEGGSDGTAIDLTNTTFDAIGSPGAAQTAKFETAGTTAPQGSTYGQIVTDVTGTRFLTKNVLQDDTGISYFRFFFRTATPTAADRYIWWLPQVSTPSVQVRRLSTGQLRLLDGYTTRWTSTKTLAADEWVRCEVRVNPLADSIRLLMWWGPQLHDETQSGDYFEASGFVTWSKAAYDRVRIGQDSPGDAITVDFDGVAYRLGTADTAAYIGSPYTNEATRLLDGSLAVGFSNSAVGDVPAAEAKTIDGSLPVALSNTATADVLNVVDGSLTVALTNTATAVAARESAASLAVAFSDTATGTVVNTVDGSLAVAFTNSAAGTVVNDVAGTLPVAFTNTSAATPVRVGSGSLAVVFSDTAAAAVERGSALTLSVSLTDTAAAALTLAGSASLPVALANTADAQVGSVLSLAVTFSNSAAGLVLNEGGATLDLTFSNTATADVDNLAVAALTVGMGNQGSAEAVRTAASSLAVAFSDTAAGTVVNDVSGSLTVALSDTAAAVSVRVAQATLTVTFTDTAAAAAVRAGAGVLPIAAPATATADVVNDVAGILTVSAPGTATTEVVRAAAASLAVVFDNSTTLDKTGQQDIQASLPVALTNTATAAVTYAAAGSLPVAAPGTADAAVLNTVAGSLAVTLADTATADVLNEGGAALTFGVAGSADAIVVHTASAALPVQVPGSASAGAAGVVNAEATLTISVNLQGTAQRAVDGSAALTVTVTPAVAGTAVRGGEGALAVAFDAAATPVRAVDVLGGLPVGFTLDLDSLLDVGLAGDLPIEFGGDGEFEGSLAVEGALLVDLDLAVTGRLTTARKELEAHLWSLVKPIGGTRLFSVAGTDRGHHWLYTLVVQVDSRGSSKKDSRDKAFAASAVMLGAKDAPWQTGVVTGTTVVSGPMWLPDENGAPRYVARYAVSAHPR